MRPTGVTALLRHVPPRAQKSPPLFRSTQCKHIWGDTGKILLIGLAGKLIPFTGKETSPTILMHR